MGYRVGIDVGGTFTDLICVTPDGQVVLDKTPTTLDDQSIGVMDGLGQLAGRFGVGLEELCEQLDILVHGTTTADNSMIEMNGAPVGLLVTEGHRDEIEMRRVHKEQIWDPSYPPPPPIARRRARIPVPQRHAYDGEELLPLDEDAVRVGVRRLAKLGCSSIAVMYLFSFVNPEHELRTREIIREEFPGAEHISLSHEVMARGPEFERVSTTLVNAYVAPRIARYVTNLSEKLRRAGYRGQLLIMQSTGGVMPPEYVARRAVSLLGSGPTGGVMGATVAARAADAPDFVAVDMGGTSFDLCLVRDCRPQIKTDWNWRYRYYIGMPMVDVQSVGAGGGSIARVRQGALLVGPESAGSNPGPVCYGRGGERPTVTDADAVLGYLPVEGFAAGRMTLDVDAARSAIARDVGEPLRLDVTAAAWGIERIVNANMANATRKVLAGYGADPRQLAMIAYGGNGPVHAWAIAAELGIGRVIVPKTAPAFSALGVLVADYVVDVMRSYVVPLSQVDLERLRALMRDVDEEVTKELEPAGLAPAAIHADLYVQMAYAGQNFDMSVPVPEGTELGEAGLLDLAERFHDLHEADRGFAFRNQQPLVRGVRLTARGYTPKPDHLGEAGTVTDPSRAVLGSRAAFFGDGFVDTPVFDGGALGVGAEIAGPALVQEPFTVVVVPPGSTCRLAPHLGYELTVT
ncbi:hydantoinase/oxoprolinase family protein [Rhabdothermincola sediminis]|uniref:hydantoinase/oxoprolinase family protein n=1 Tax=Rhabdothermincola sediminis TaxID=2751370 RepID=UPI001AA02BD2|nr:hydantoinase/oxoprolinase family protein [Rhabdothermincola sediminis]